MSEPARHYAQQDQATRPQPGPLRDWLAAMKAVTAATTPDAPALQPREPQKVQEQASEPRAAEAPNPWTPRVVAPVPATSEPAASDVSELMAENIMLKAKLKVENDRYDAIQGVIVRELRNLRTHVEEEMRELETLRAERDHLAARQAAFEQQVRDLRADLEAEAAKLGEMRSERDLWAARAEALAQPIFQKRATA